MKHILVAGGAGGVGHSLLGMLIERGDSVTATVLNAAEADLVRKAYGDAVAVHEVDLGDNAAAVTRLNEIVAGMDRLDAVAMCAGYQDTGPVELASIDSFRKMYEVNCLSVVALFQSCASALRASKGRVIAISSTAGLIALPFVGGYAVSKFALEAVMDVIRRETYGQGIKFSLVEPGWIRTSMASNQMARIRERLDALSDEDRQRYGSLYTGFEQNARESWDTASSEPGDIAAVIVEAIDADEPKTRYLPGTQGPQMMELMGGMSDVQLDEFLHQMM